MCGLIAYKGLDVSKGLLNIAHQTMKNRGLDNTYCQKEISGEGFYIAHNTLPLVTDNQFSFSQPSLKHDKKTYFAFTGEIFNFKDINSDAKVDTELFYGPIDFNKIHQYDGFWNYVEVNSKILFGFTDFLSIKPLYYRTDMNVLASEPFALAVLKSTKPDKVFESNVRKWGYSPDNRTQWEEVKQIPPGHAYYNGEIYPYWDWDKVPYDGDLVNLLKESIERRTRGIGRMALLLSGGLDSSLIYSMIDKSKVKTFHVSNGEHEYAKLMDPNVEELKLDDVTRYDSIFIHQTPVDLGSVIPQTAMAKAMNKEGYNVVITGDGADELFGGYRRAKEYDSQMSDVFVELPYYHLPRLDRINMAYTIECRSPFLSPKIIKFAMGLPYNLRTSKQYLKIIAKGFVPDQIINRDKFPLRMKNEKV